MNVFRSSTDWLYPPSSPYRHGRLKVSAIHELYYEEVGNPAGKPVVYLHGGPGAGLSETHRRFHNPEKYRIILFDQRGSGKSTPAASIEENTTWDLVADIEKLRAHLSIDKWQVFGGSWGSTLALAYAISHPEKVSEIILRGIFLSTQDELDWFYRGKGANFIFPDAWEPYVGLIPENERSDMISAYYKRLTSTDKSTREEAARRWTVYENSLLALIQDPKVLKEADENIDQAEKVARIECHYFLNKSFFKTDNYLIENISKIRHIPAVIVQGRYDVICPPRFAWNLHRAWPEADCYFIADAGHSVAEPNIAKTLITATDRFAGV